MDVYLTEASGYPVQGVWSTYDKAVAQLIRVFGIDVDELRPDEDDHNVWWAPGDMGMMRAYITKKTVDEE